MAVAPSSIEAYAKVGTSEFIELNTVEEILLTFLGKIDVEGFLNSILTYYYLLESYDAVVSHFCLPI